MTPHRLGVLSSAAIFALAGIASGDKPRQPVHEDVSVSLVEVPVNVFDRTGQPVRDLTASDFTIEDDGKPQKIDSLDAFDLNRLSPTSTNPEYLPSVAVRRFLLLFDLSFAQPKNLARASSAAYRFVEKSLSGEDLVAVATISNEHGIRLLANFSRDRAQAEKAIETLGLEVPSGRANDPLAFAFITPGDPFVASLLPPDFSRPGQPGEMASYSNIMAMVAKSTVQRHDVTQVERQLAQIHDLAQALDLVNGRKEILFFTEGFDSRLLLGNMGRTGEENAGVNESMLHGKFWETPVDDRYLNTPLQHQMDEALGVFRRSDCVVYPIKIATLHAGGDASTEGRESVPTSDAALFPYAEATGGEVIENSNDLDAQMRRVLQRTSLVYVLSFRPTKSNGKGGFHNLKVKVNRRHVSVSSRAGYFEAREFHGLNPLERVLSSAEIVTRGEPGGKLPIEVALLPLAARDLGEVSVFVHVLPPAFAGSLERRSLGVYLYLRDPAGRLVDYLTRGISVDPKEQEKALNEGGITYFSNCHALAGDYELSVLVRDEQSGEFGFQRLPVHLSDTTQSELRVLPPLFLRTAENGLTIRDSVQGMRSDDLLHLGGAYYVPSAGNRLPPEKRTKMCLFVYGKPGADFAGYRIDAVITDPKGGAQEPAILSLVGRTSTDAEGLMRLLLEFDSENLAPGDYALKVRVRSTDHDLASPWTSTSFHVS